MLLLIKAMATESQDGMSGGVHVLGIICDRLKLRIKDTYLVSITLGQEVTFSTVTSVPRLAGQKAQGILIK